MLPITSEIPLGSTPTLSPTKCCTINVPLSLEVHPYIRNTLLLWMDFLVYLQLPLVSHPSTNPDKVLHLFPIPFRHSCMRIPWGTHSQPLRIQARPLQISRILNRYNLQHNMMTVSYDMPLNNTHSYLLRVCCYPLKLITHPVLRKWYHPSYPKRPPHCKTNWKRVPRLGWNWTHDFPISQQMI